MEVTGEEEAPGLSAEPLEEPISAAINEISHMDVLEEGIEGQELQLGDMGRSGREGKVMGKNLK